MLKRPEIKIFFILHKLALSCSTVAKEIIPIGRLNWMLCGWWLHLTVIAEPETGYQGISACCKPWNLAKQVVSQKLFFRNLSVVTTGTYMSEGFRDQWGCLYCIAIAELSGTRGIMGWRSAVSYPGMDRQNICAMIRLEKLQLCPAWLWLPKSESGAWMDPVSGLSYRGHCKPTSETTAMLFCNTVTPTLNAGWKLFVCKQYLYLVPVCTVTNKNVMYSS